MKAFLKTLYEDVELRGSGRGKFVVLNKGLKGAVISVGEDDKSWFVELWSEGDPTTGEENLIDERTIKLREDAIRRVCNWLDGN
jgi:hypothetical protein